MNDNYLFISEIFGPTIQGEGSTAGRNAYFLRTFGCHLHCKFCDTAYTWRFSDTFEHNSGIVYNKSQEMHEISIEGLADKLIVAGTGRLVITGGEPLLQQENLIRLLKIMLSKNPMDMPSIEVETSGSIKPQNAWEYFNPQFNVSPKLSSSGNNTNVSVRYDILKLFVEYDAIFKFVVVDKSDISEILNVVNEVKIPNDKIWLMAEGATTNDQLRNMTNVVQLAIENGFNFSPRVHTLIWGNKRGV